MYCGPRLLLSHSEIGGGSSTSSPIGIEGRSWQVSGLKPDTESGGYILESTPKQAENLRFFEGVAHLLVQKYPRLTQYGFAFLNGKLLHPDIISLNERLRRSKNFNGLLFVSTSEESSHLEMVELFARGKTIWAKQGELFFHDPLLHGLGYILFPKKLVEMCKAYAVLLTDLWNYKDGILRDFLEPYVATLANNIDAFSDNLLRILLRTNNPRSEIESLMKDFFVREIMSFHRQAGVDMSPKLHEFEALLTEHLRSSHQFVAEETEIAGLLASHQIPRFSVTPDLLDEIEDKLGPRKLTGTFSIVDGTVPLFLQ